MKRFTAMLVLATVASVQPAWAETMLIQKDFVGVPTGTYSNIGALEYVNGLVVPHDPFDSGIVLTGKDAGYIYYSVSFVDFKGKQQGAEQAKILNVYWRGKAFVTQKDNASTCTKVGKEQLASDSYIFSLCNVRRYSAISKKVVLDVMFEAGGKSINLGHFADGAAFTASVSVDYSNGVENSRVSVVYRQDNEGKTSVVKSGWVPFKSSYDFVEDGTLRFTIYQTKTAVSYLSTMKMSLGLPLLKKVPLPIPKPKPTFP